MAPMRYGIMLFGDADIRVNELLGVTIGFSGSHKRAQFLASDKTLGAGVIFSQAPWTWFKEAEKLRVKYPSIKIYRLTSHELQALITDDRTFNQAHNALAAFKQWQNTDDSQAVRCLVRESAASSTNAASSSTNAVVDLTGEDSDSPLAEPSPQPNRSDGRLPDVKYDLMFEENTANASDPAPCASTRRPSVQSGEEPPFLLSYVVAGSDMNIEKSKMLYDTFSKPLPDPIPKLRPTVAPDDKALYQKLRSKAFLAAQTYVDGSSPFYKYTITTSQNEGLKSTFEGEEDAWLTKNIAEAWTKTTHFSSLQGFADRFSKTFDLQRFHPYTLYVRFGNKRIGNGVRLCAEPTRSQWRLAVVLLMGIMDTVMSKEPERPAEIRPESWWSIKDMRYAEWVSIIGTIFLEDHGVMMGVQSFHNRFKNYAEEMFPVSKLPPAKIAENASKRELCFTFKSGRFGCKAMEVRAAAGARPDGKTLAIDAFPMNCDARTPVANVMSEEELRSAKWITFTFHQADSLKRKRDGVKIEADVELAAVDSGLDTLKALTDSKQILDDRTMVLRGRCPPGKNPVILGSAISAAWKQDVNYNKEIFQGPMVTRAAYRCIGDDLTELALTFASRGHLAAACLTFPSWIKLLAFTEIPMYIYTAETRGFLHPLSALSAEAKESRVTMPFQIQRAFVHPNNAVMPDSVMVTYMKHQDFRAKVRYPSPSFAAPMIGLQVPVYGVGTWPFRVRKETEPLSFFLGHHNVEHCSRCGSLGHFKVQCKSAPRTDGNYCSICAKLGRKHKKESACETRNAFNENAFRTLKAAADASTITGIFAAEHKEMLHKLFGEATAASGESQ